MDATAWSRGLEVTGGGTGVVSHAGLVLLRQLCDRTGLTARLSAALPTPDAGADRGRVFADLACATADGARVISDFRVMSDRAEAFGQVASVPTAWRALKETAAGGDGTRRKIAVAISKARRYAWSQITARHGQLPPLQVADRQLAGITCIPPAGQGGQVHAVRGLVEAFERGDRWRGGRVPSGRLVRPERADHRSKPRDSAYGDGVSPALAGGRSVRLSREEEEQLRVEAAKQGQSLSQFIREVLRNRGGDDSGVADVTLYSTTATVVGGGLALEADDGVLAPRTSRPHVTTSYTG